LAGVFIAAGAFRWPKILKVSKPMFTASYPGGKGCMQWMRRFYPACRLLRLRCRSWPTRIGLVVKWHGYRATSLRYPATYFFRIQMCQESEKMLPTGLSIFSRPIRSGSANRGMRYRAVTPPDAKYVSHGTH